jgi:quinol monooxygenase YgiN
MAWTMIEHQVNDYNTWKQVFDHTAEVKRRYGWKKYRIFQVAQERTHLIVMDQFERADQAQEYLNSDFLQNVFKQMGVVGTPTVRLLEGLEEGAA